MRKAQLDARRAASRKRAIARLRGRPYERAVLRPFVYPVTKAVRIANQPPSRERTVDAAALALTRDASERRVAVENRRRAHPHWGSPIDPCRNSIRPPGDD
jgi:hypothetical protein